MRGAYGGATVLLVALSLLEAEASDARRAVEAFVGRIADVRITDLTIHQTLTVYHPDGRRPQSTGEQHVYIKLPRRQRIEQDVEGQSEVRLSVGDRTWVRRADGRTYDAPLAERDRTHHLFTPLRRSAADLLAEWQSFGVRSDVSQVVRVRGRPVVIVGAGPDDRSSPTVWLDEEYGVVRVIRRERFPAGPVLADLALSEHRPLVEGFYFPHRQELFADGRLVLLIVVRSIAVDRGLPDQLFDPESLRAGR